MGHDEPLHPRSWSTAQRRRIDELVLATAGLEPDDRSPVLEADTFGDPHVLAEVRRRLAAADALPDDYLESPISALLGAVEGADQPTGPSFATPACERYELVRCLGSGGMAEVHEAIDRELDRRVALKLLRSADPGIHRRFQAEARSQARVQHDHVLEVYEAGWLDDWWKAAPWEPWLRLWV